jgi:hypothetical protein
MLNKVNYITRHGDKWVRVSEQFASLVDIESLTGLSVDINEPLRTYSVFGWPLICDERGLSMRVWRPVIPSGGEITDWVATSKEACYHPRGWGDWLGLMESNGLPRNLVIGATGYQALDWWVRFQTWAVEAGGLQAAELLSGGTSTLDEVMEAVPWAEHVTVFRECVANLALAGSLPKKGRGQRGRDPKIKRAVLELFALACELYRQFPEMSWEAAYEDACSKRPGWVPETWRSGDPAGRLKKEAENLKGSRWLEWRNRD